MSKSVDFFWSKKNVITIKGKWYKIESECGDIHHVDLNDINEVFLKLARGN